MSEHRDALGWAEAQVAAARDDPPARLALIARTYYGPTGRAPRHLPFRRAALSFMRWQVRRGLLNPLGASPPGSVWWRAMNERLLRDGCEAIALVGGLPGDPSSQAVRLWLEFVATPTPSHWYRAHNASIVAGYLEHEGLAEEESAPERFFMNVVLARVLYAHALVAAPRLALGRLAGLARTLGDPRLGMAGVFLSLRRVVPNRYPLARDVEWYIADEQRLGRMLDYAVIVPRLQRLYEWSAEELAESRLLELVRDGTRSTRGRSPNDTSGALRTCRSRLGCSNASHGLADVPPANRPASRRTYTCICPGRRIGSVNISSLYASPIPEAPLRRAFPPLRAGRAVSHRS